MKFVDEYRDPELGQRLVRHIRRRSSRPVQLMEFCGGHTAAILKHGIRQLLPDNIEMLSGPGCPVCVTSAADLDRAIALSHLPNVIIATFGDMVRVPGSSSSLQQAQAGGSDVRVVYSTQDALKVARDNPAKCVIFIGIGFETTAPTIAASILQAEAEGMDNYYVLALNKLCPPVMKALLNRGEVRLDGIIGPGHVSAVIGSHPYRFIPDAYGLACAVSGFEPLDILQAIATLIEQIETGRPDVAIAYRRGVQPEGNRAALEIMDAVFDVSVAEWRGLGTIPDSGLRLKSQYRSFDAEVRFPIATEPSTEAEGCICGDILRGVSTPPHCRLFRQACTPEHPVGPCMVSAEGTCASYYHYGEIAIG